jgi:hypothetical protein
MLLDSIVKLHDKIQNMKLGANRQDEITELEQARLRRLPLAVSVGAHDFARAQPKHQAALPEPAPSQPWPFLAQPAEAQHAPQPRHVPTDRPAGPEPEPGSHE